jgi:hypothetical protein
MNLSADELSRGKRALLHNLPESVVLSYYEAECLVQAVHGALAAPGTEPRTRLQNIAEYPEASGTGASGTEPTCGTIESHIGHYYPGPLTGEWCNGTPVEASGSDNALADDDVERVAHALYLDEYDASGAKAICGTYDALHEAYVRRAKTAIAALRSKPAAESTLTRYLDDCEAGYVGESGPTITVAMVRALLARDRAKATRI